MKYLLCTFTIQLYYYTVISLWISLWIGLDWINQPAFFGTAPALVNWCGYSTPSHLGAKFDCFDYFNSTRNWKLFAKTFPSSFFFFRFISFTVLLSYLLVYKYLFFMELCYATFCFISLGFETLRLFLRLPSQLNTLIILSTRDGSEL